MVTKIPSIPIGIPNFLINYVHKLFRFPILRFPRSLNEYQLSGLTLCLGQSWTAYLSYLSYTFRVLDTPPPTTPQPFQFVRSI